MRLKHILAALLAATLALGGCAQVQTTRGGAVGVNRTQYMMISQQEAEQMASASYLQTKREAAAKGVLNEDPQQVARLRRIADRIIPQTTVFRDDARGWKWEVNLQTSNEVNAYCMPGGKIMFYTGILDKLQLTDDEVAAVMGHEIAHALREHSREKMSQIYGQQMVLLGIALLTKGDDRKVALASSVATLAITLPNSRENETEADRIGLELAARAGYDPRAAVSLWRKMGAEGGSRPPEFLSTHPAPENRQADIQRLLPTVMPLYEAAAKPARGGKEKPVQAVKRETTAVSRKVYSSPDGDTPPTTTLRKRRD